MKMISFFLFLKLLHFFKYILCLTFLNNNNSVFIISHLIFFINSFDIIILSIISISFITIDIFKLIIQKVSKYNYCACNSKILAFGS